MHMTDATHTASTSKTTAITTNNPSAEPTTAACDCDTPMKTLCGTRNCSLHALMNNAYPESGLLFGVCGVEIGETYDLTTIHRWQQVFPLPVVKSCLLLRGLRSRFNSQPVRKVTGPLQNTSSANEFRSFAQEICIVGKYVHHDILVVLLALVTEFDDRQIKIMDEVGLPRSLLKFSGGSVHDYATIFGESPSPS